MNENLPVAIQVYGLRDLLEETPERFEEVMCSVKEMGYQGVELAGLYGLEPGEVKRILDKVGSVSYTHLDVYKRQGEWNTGIKMQTKSPGLNVFLAVSFNAVTDKAGKQIFIL